MPGPSRLEIIDVALSYLEKGQYEDAVKYLRDARERVVKEIEGKRKAARRRRTLVDLCKELVGKDENAAKEIMSAIERKVEPRKE